MQEQEEKEGQDAEKHQIGNASADLLPNQHSGLVSTEETFSMNELVFTESSCSINTYWGLPPASSLSIDENEKLHAICSPSKPSVFGYSELNWNLGNESESLSLPRSNENNPVLSTGAIDKTNANLKKKLELF